MMTNKFILEDLTMVLETIGKVRAEWIAKIEEKAKEYMELHPEVSYEKAQSEVFLNQEVHEVHSRLIALYGCIGSCSDRYVGALKGSEEPQKKLFIERRSKSRKKAA